MRVLLVLTYYRPHTSGLTIYAERLARGLVARGHDVTILTSRFDPRTPREEREGRLRIVRAPVLFRVSKGVVMPSFGWQASRLVRSHDVVSLHLPQLDAAGVALRSRLLRRPTTLTYHCDLSLPPGRFNGMVNRIVESANEVAARLAHRIVAYTEDFARASPYLSRHARKVTIVPPPVEVVGDVDAAAVASWRERRGIRPGGPLLGMAARLASEKGVEVLLEALPRIARVHPAVRVLFAGQHENVLGEEAYAQRLAPLLDRERARWTFLGVLDEREMAAFFSTIDLIVVPSLNSTESFGLVQVEAMLRGTPAVASALPGVRQPVLQTGMGEVAPVGDAAGLAETVLRVLARRGDYVRPAREIAARFSTAATAAAYEELFERLCREIR